MAGHRGGARAAARERRAARPGIGLSGQMHGLVALDGADRVLRPAILWNDQRTAAQCAQIERTVGLERLIELTGNRALPGLHRAQAAVAARTRARAVARRSRGSMLPKDYVRLRLCGEHATDVSDASGTLLLDVPARGWSRRGARGARARSRAGCREVLESPAVSGTDALTASRWRRGAGDQAAGALGVGVDAPGSAVGRARHLRRRVRRLRALRGRPARPRARLLPRRARTPGT